jgi:hypothetical protein
MGSRAAAEEPDRLGVELRYETCHDSLQRRLFIGVVADVRAGEGMQLILNNDCQVVACLRISVE